MDRELLNSQIKRAQMLLANRDIQLYVGGCGCCGSPSVYLEIEGEPIVYDTGEIPTEEIWRKAADDARIDTSSE